jgi:hypothetical protein
MATTPSPPIPDAVPLKEQEDYVAVIRRDELLYIRRSLTRVGIRVPRDAGMFLILQLEGSYLTQTPDSLTLITPDCAIPNISCPEVQAQIEFFSNELRGTTMKDGTLESLTVLHECMMCGNINTVTILYSKENESGRCRS